MITNYATCRCEIKSRIAMAKAAFNNKKAHFTSKLGLSLRQKLVNCYTWSMTLYDAETWTLWKVDQKYLENFEIWRRRAMEIIWTNHVRNEEVLHTVKEERKILHKIKGSNTN
jgi:hypothetical protein